MRLTGWIPGLVISLILLITSSAHASDWERTDTYLLIGSTTLLALDWAQTRQIASDSRYFERNPVMGRNPSRSHVDRYFTFVIAANIITAPYMPKKTRRKIQTILIILETAAVTHNWSIGIRF